MKTLTAPKPKKTAPSAQPLPTPAPTPEVAPVETIAAPERLPYDRWALYFWIGGVAILLAWHFGDFLYSLWLR